MYQFISSGTCETNGMRSIHDVPSCKAAATTLGKTINNFRIRSASYGARKPKGCSWYNDGNVELWQSSSGDCDKGYHGCFCLNIQGKELIPFLFHCNPYLIQGYPKISYIKF